MKRRIPYITWFAALPVTCFLLGLNISAGLSGPRSVYAGSDQGDDTLHLPPDELHALAVARYDFNKKLKKEFVGNSTPTQFHLSIIENYTLQVRKLGRKYEVRIGPKLFEGIYFKGGGTIYFIDVKSFKILKIEHEM